MGYSGVKLVAYFVFGVFVLGKGDLDKKCDLKNIPSGCSVHETCAPDSNGIGRCKCVVGQKIHEDGVCTQESTITTPTPNGVTAASRVLPSEAGNGSITSGSSVAAGVLIPLVVIAFLVSVVFLARRYRWPQRLRQLRARHYDEMQIGQDDDDDPPIA